MMAERVEVEARRHGDSLVLQAEVVIATVSNELTQQQAPLLARAYWALARIAYRNGLHHQAMVGRA